MFKQEHQMWISKPSIRDKSLAELEASLLAMEQQNKELSSLKHDLVSHKHNLRLPNEYRCQFLEATIMCHVLKPIF